MSNELLLVLSLLFTFLGVILCFHFLKEQGLYLWTIVATIAANIEVLIVVDAYGMEMTLGNILFASTFLVTDILSELYGKKEARQAVVLGITTSVLFILISQSWMLYTPNASDFVSPSIRTIFSNTPRLMFASLSVYVVVQFLDVWLYHTWWTLTTRLTGSKEKGLWLRNNGSTLLSQFLNAVLYTFAAFYGVYEMDTLLSIAISTYAISIITSLADTPFIYLARRLH